MLHPPVSSVVVIVHMQVQEAGNQAAVHPLDGNQVDHLEDGLKVAVHLDGLKAVVVHLDGHRAVAQVLQPRLLK